MCTVTYLPMPDGGYLLGTNRDERPHRGQAQAPSLRVLGDRQVLAPIDGDAGGTWVALDDQGRSLCLLNGDKKPAAKPPTDPRSRGLLVLDLMSDASVDGVTSQLLSWAMSKDLPYRTFKLLSIERDPALRARLLEWNGRELVVRQLTSPSLVVSSTYETDAVTARRRQSFTRLVSRLEEGETTTWSEELATWHSGHRPGGDDGDAYSICMHRDDAHTVSRTQVQVSRDGQFMSYQPGQPCAGAPVELHHLPAAPKTV